MDATITVRITKDLRIQVSRKVLGRGLWVSYVTAVIMFLPTLAGVFAIVACPQLVLSEPIIWLPALAFALIILSICLLRRAVRNAGNSRWGDIDVTYRITDEAVHCQSPYDTGTYPWRIFPRLQRFPDLWLLYTTRVNAFILPTDQLTEEVREFIIAKVREAGGKVK